MFTVWLSVVPVQSTSRKSHIRNAEAVRRNSTQLNLCVHCAPDHCTF